MIIIDKQPGFWVVNKPVGLSVNDNDGQPGLIRQLAAEHPGIKFQPVHRLDKETSGLLLVAVDADHNRRLSRAFAEHAIQKTYIAITQYGVGKKPKKKQGRIRGDMTASRNGNYKLLTSKNNPAITTFKSKALSERKRFVVLTPTTGKTHQLRVAMKAMAMPIVGDTRYGGSVSDRMYLHAYRLIFELDDHRYFYQALPELGDIFTGLDIPALEAEFGSS